MSETACQARTQQSLSFWNGAPQGTACGSAAARGRPPLPASRAVFQIGDRYFQHSALRCPCACLTSSKGSQDGCAVGTPGLSGPGSDEGPAVSGAWGAQILLAGRGRKPAAEAGGLDRDPLRHFLAQPKIAKRQVIYLV